MKKILFSTILSVLSLFSFSQVVNENFSSGLPAGWTNTFTSDTSFMFTNPDSRVITGPGFDANFAIIDSDFRGGGVTQGAILTTSSFSTVGNNVVTLEYSESYRTCCGSMGYVKVSTDNGVTWDTVNTNSNTNVGYVNPAVVTTVDISSVAANSASVTVAWDYTGSFDWWWAIDSVVVNASSVTCIDPSSPMSSSITANTALVNWTEAGTATQWEVEWDTAGFTAGSAANSMIVNTDTFMTITGLSSSTAYDWNVRAICAAMDTSGWVGASFSTTIQGPVGFTCTTGNPSVVFSDDLESMNGWTGDIGTGTQATFWNYDANGTGSGGTGPSAAHSGTQYAYYEASFPSALGDSASFISPAIDLTIGNNFAELSFWLHAFGANIGTLKVGVGTSATGPFTQVFTSSGQIQTANADPWSNVGVNLDAYVGQTIYLEFLYEAVAGFTGDLAIDLIEVSTCASCSAPSSLVASSVTATSADVAWTENGTATLWEVEYGVAGSGTTTRDTSSLNPFSLSGLASSTTYDYSVRAICGPADSSGFSSTASFTTAFQCPVGAICATYTAGNIDTDLSFTSLPGTSTCPSNLQLIIPTGNRVDSLESFYDMSTASNGFMSEQRSWLYSPSSGMGEASITLGTGNSTGTLSYLRSGLSFANGVTDTLNVEMHAGRTFGSTGCTVTHNMVDSATWTVVAYYSLIPTCVEPNTVVATAGGTDTATVSWVNPNTGGALFYQLSYGPTGTSAANGTKIIVSTNPAGIGGLAAGTAYDVYVRTICTVGDTSGWSQNVASFTTLYGIPYNQDFEGFPGGTAVTDGWFRSGTSMWRADVGGTPSTATGPTIDHTLGTGAGTYMYTETSGPAAGSIDTLSSASIAVGMTQTSLTFTYWYHMAGATMGEMQVWVESGGVWDSVTTYVGPQHVNQADPWLVASHVLTTYAGQSITLKFIGVRGTSFSGDMAIDDISIIETPSCLAPTALVDSFATLTSVQLAWTENNSATTWDIEYGPTGFTPGTGITVAASTNPYVLTGLTASSTYDYYVISNCGPGNISPLSFKASFATLNGVPYFQNFDGFSGVNSEGWTNVGGANPAWLADAGGTPSTGTGPTVDHTTGTASGTYIFLETSGGAAGDDDTLWSAPITVSPTQTILSLEYWYHMHGASIGDLKVFMVDSAGVATLIDSIGGQQQVNQGDPYLRKVVTVNGYAGQDVSIMFVGTRGSSFTGDIAIDDVKLDVPPPNNLGVTSIVSPSSGCGLSATASVQVEVTNFGSAAQSNYSIGYALNGVAITPETVAATIMPGATASYTFTSTANLSTVGAYSIDAYTMLTNDSDTTNDSSSINLNSLATIATFPYSESFETGAGDWVITGNSSWELGAPINTIIDTASHGTQAWVTDLDANYGDGEAGSVNSPCFDFTSVPDPNISLDIWWNIENSWDGAVLQSSIDQGVTWQIVGAFGDPNNWYTDNTIDALGDNGIEASEQGWTGLPGSGGWVTATHYLTGLGGLSSVQLRVAFASDGNTNNEGMAFDNVSIFDQALPDPYYTIGTINTEDSTGAADSLNVDCFISGTVVGIDLDGNNGLSFTIIDMSSGMQEGMNIFNFNDVSGYVVTEGDSIMVHGSIAQFNGLTELVPDSILVLSSGNALPTPIVVTSLDETTESRYLSIPTSFVSLSTTTGLGSDNVTITNGIDTLTMRIDGDTDIDDTLFNRARPIIPGDTICGLLGVGGQFDNTTPRTGGYQIFPMRWSDLIICRSTVGINDAEVVEAQFTLAPNPTTGEFMIKSSGFDNATIRVVVRDISGRILSSEFINNANSTFQKSFDLSENASGIYFISIQDGENVINQKLILH